VVTVIGLQVGVLFTGAILTETIFSWPGVGKWLIEAISRRDYPVLQGGMLLLGVHGHGGESAGGHHLRHHQSAHPAPAMSDTLTDTTGRAQHRAHAAARVLGLFQRQPRALAGLVIVIAVLLMAAVCAAAGAYAPDLTNNAAFLKPPFWQEGRLDGIPAGH
jgi:hypothetical protein